MNDQDKHIYYFEIPLVFPAGLAPGAGRTAGNLLMLSKDGQDRPVLRGTAIAGVLRHAWAKLHGLDPASLGHDNELAEWFGYALGDDASENGAHHDRPSPLRISDAVLNLSMLAEKSDLAETDRMHNSIDRHRGAVRGQALFSIKALPPGTTTNLVGQLHCDCPSEAAETFLAELVSLIDAGLTFGGHGARGLGMGTRNGTASCRLFDLGSVEGHAAWLDASWQWRKSPDAKLSSGESVTLATLDNPERILRVKARLVVPRGQDICIGSGQGGQYDIEPQRVLSADGQLRWRLPGSSLRGVFRAWINRLAARDSGTDSPVDTVDRFQREIESNANPADAGWLYHSKEIRTENQRKLDNGDALETVATCPVARLFGSLYGAGRIHISDAISSQPAQESTDEADLQHRRHVAVDRVTGGANEGFLFDHGALQAGTTFDFEMRVETPSDQEARWLAETLRALHMGLIRVGSSKSSGRLALQKGPSACGKGAEHFESVIINEVSS